MFGNLTKLKVDGTSFPHESIEIFIERLLSDVREVAESSYLSNCAIYNRSDYPNLYQKAKIENRKSVLTYYLAEEETIILQDSINMNENGVFSYPCVFYFHISTPYSVENRNLLTIAKREFTDIMTNNHILTDPTSTVYTSGTSKNGIYLTPIPDMKYKFGCDLDKNVITFATYRPPESIEQNQNYCTYVIRMRIIIFNSFIPL